MMTPKEFIDATLFFVSQWAGIAVPRVAAVFVGIAICVLTVSALWSRRVRAGAGTVWLAAGILLMVIGLNTDVLHWLVNTSYLTRIRLLMGFLSLLVLAVTIEAIRRSQLKERYALLWVTTGLIILLCAFFPAVLGFFSVFLGIQYVTAVVAVVFTFMVLVAFHFSIALSGFHEDQTRIAQRCALLEARVEQLAAELAALRGSSSVGGVVPVPVIPAAPSSRPKPEAPRRWQGATVVAALIVGVALAAVLAVGLVAPQAMIGDEANRPTCALTPLYPALFWLQLLLAAWCLARGSRRLDTPAVVLYLLVLASLPMGLMFATAFSPDVPLAAQVLAAFCLLDRRRWVWASVFMALALGIQATAVLFLPAFLVFLVVRTGRVQSPADSSPPPVWRQLAQAIVPLATALAILAVPVFIAAALKDAAWSDGCPLARMKTLTCGWTDGLHPGDRRTVVDYLIHGGGLLWGTLLLGAVRYLQTRRSSAAPDSQALWPLGVGVSYALFLACVLRAAPDARLFLPAMPFLLLPFAGWATRTSRPRRLLCFVAALAILQAGLVQVRTYHLRRNVPDLPAAVEVTSPRPPEPGGPAAIP